jgi:hypothetical protein
MNTHNQINELLVGFALGELSELQRQDVEKHLADCIICRTQLAQIQSLLKATEKIGKITADGELHQAAVSEVFEAIARTKLEPALKHKNIWRAIMKNPITKLAATAAAIIVTVLIFSWFSLQKESNRGPDVLSGFSLLAKACAAEDAIFAGENIVHIKNEITVYPVSFDEISSGQSESADFNEHLAGDSNDLNTKLDFTWLPMSSLKANGQFAFNQLKLSIRTEPYTVIDQAWYEPATGHFARVLQTDGKTVFANSYDGEFVYTSQIAPDGTLQLTKELVTKEFRPPQKPAEFLGLAAGLQTSLQKDTSSMVQGVEEGALWDGSPAHIYKVGFPDPSGRLTAYFLFKVRDEDETIAEKEFVISGRTQLLIRRVLTESVQAPQVSWNLAEVEGLNIADEAKPKVSITPDMVIPNVTIQHMVEKARFETYIFSSNPPWADNCEITDIEDLPSPGYRMFMITFRAEDGRHIVLVQAYTYNKMLGNVAKTGRLVYTSPNGFKVWGGGPDKWFSQILLQSAKASIKNPPADDRVGYMLESPAGTFPALAINGPVSDEELHNLIDSLIPAKDYLKN